MAAATEHAELRAVHGPAVWHGPAMARRTDWQRPLTDAEIAELDAAVRALDAGGIDVAAIRPADLAVPGLRALIDQVKRAVLDETGFILVRGLPVDRWTMRQCAIAYFGLGALIGEPVSQNAKGHILGHVKDIGFDYARPSHRGYQTAARLPYHCDSSDVVALLCVKPARAGGLSSIASSGDLQRDAEPASRPRRRTRPAGVPGPARRGAGRRRSLVRGAGVQSHAGWWPCDDLCP